MGRAAGTEERAVGPIEGSRGHFQVSCNGTLKALVAPLIYAVFKNTEGQSGFICSNPVAAAQNSLFSFTAGWHPHSRSQMMKILRTEPVGSLMNYGTIIFPSSAVSVIFCVCWHMLCVPPAEPAGGPSELCRLGSEAHKMSKHSVYLVLSGCEGQYLLPCIFESNSDVTVLSWLLKGPPYQCFTLIDTEYFYFPR